MKKFSVIVLFFIVLFTACKYDEGPIISFRTYEKRISGNWEIEYAAVSGTEVALPVNKTLSLESGYTFRNNSPIVSRTLGIWSFNGSYTSVVFYNNTSLDTLYNEYQITKLRYKMLWIINDPYEYHLRKRE